MVVTYTRAVARRHARGIAQCATKSAISSSARTRVLPPSTCHHHAPWSSRSARLTRNTFSKSATAKQQSNTPPTPAASTPPTTHPTQESALPSTEQQQEEDQQKQHRQRRTRRRILFAGAFLFLGSTLGSIVRTALAPPELPAPGSEQDIYLLSSLREKASRLDLHKHLSSDPAWESWDAYEGFPKASSTSPPQEGNETKPHHPPPPPNRRITSDILTSSRAIAYQRIFHNPTTHEVISIVYLGGSVAGWPGVVHGGLLATLLDESLGRCAILLFPARMGVTANLELNYKKPTRTEGWYVIRTNPLPVSAKEDDAAAAAAAVVPPPPVGGTGVTRTNTGSGSGGWGSWLWGSKSSSRSSGGRESESVKLTGGKKSDRKRWITGTLEKLDGTVCVKAKALFVVPKGAKVGPISPRF